MLSWRKLSRNAANIFASTNNVCTLRCEKRSSYFSDQKYILATSTDLIEVFIYLFIYYAEFVSCCLITHIVKMQTQRSHSIDFSAFCIHKSGKKISPNW